MFCVKAHVVFNASSGNPFLYDITPPPLPPSGDRASAATPSSVAAVDDFYRGI